MDVRESPSGLLMALACATILLNPACGESPPNHPRTIVRFTTGDPGGGFFPVGEGLHASAGAVTNVEAIQRATPISASPSRMSPTLRLWAGSTV